MRLESVTFYCDANMCREKFTTSETGEASSYLDMSEAGWKVSRFFTGWKHYCPEHRETKP